MNLPGRGHVEFEATFLALSEESMASSIFTAQEQAERARKQIWSRAGDLTILQYLGTVGNGAGHFLEFACRTQQQLRKLSTKVDGVPTDTGTGVAPKYKSKRWPLIEFP